MESPNNRVLSELAAAIVAAYVSNNSLKTDALATLISDVYGALARAPTTTSVADRKPQEPAVGIKASVRPDFIICLEDGRRFKSLKRHISREHNLTPGEYRAKWRLPYDYPMVAPNYAKARSELAKAMGLGTKPETVKVNGSAKAPRPKSRRSSRRAS